MGDPMVTRKSLTRHRLVSLCFVSFAMAAVPARASVSDGPAPHRLADATTGGLYQTSSDDSAAPGSDWGDVTRTFKEVGFRITHPTVKQGIFYGSIAAIAYVAHREKWEMSTEAQEDRTPSSDHIAATFRPFGEAVIPILAFGTYAIG